MFKDPRKWIIAAVLVVAFAISFPAVYFRQESESKIRSQTNLVSLIKQVELAVVYIEAQTYEGYILRTGSGVIIDPNGIVVTAAHILRNANRFKIILPDGREFYSGISFCKSELTDVGFIKINVEGLPFSYLGNSDYLKKGQQIFNMGCPFGYELRFTVTSGIISGLNRDIDGPFGKRLLFQVDAQGWPGLSGGPVFNMKGQMIGIHVGGRAYYDGLNMCVPVNTIKEILDVYEAERELKDASSHN